MSQSDKWRAPSAVSERTYVGGFGNYQNRVSKWGKQKKTPIRKNRTFSDVVRELPKRVTNEKNDGNYYQWSSKRVTDLTKDYIGIPFLKSEIDSINVYNNYATSQLSLDANGKKYSLSYFFSAEELNHFDNSYRVALIRYAASRLFNDQKIYENIFASIWTRREYKERRKYLQSLRPVHVAIWRSGVIPFYFSGDTIYFGFAHDTTYIEESGGKSSKYSLSDFGGGVEIGESAAMAAIREWSEESLGLFPRYTIRSNEIVSVYHGVAIYFVDITNDRPPNMELGNEPHQFPGNISSGLDFTLQTKLKEWETNHKMPNDFPEVGGVTWMTVEDVMDRLSTVKSAFDDFPNEENRKWRTLGDYTDTFVPPLFYDSIIPNIISINQIEKIIAFG